jgi:hypothetical protein
MFLNDIEGGERMYCANCGSNVPDSSKFCSACGHIQPASSESQLEQPFPAKVKSDNPGYPQPYPATYVPRPIKDRNIALIIEILPGLFGFLGFGWMYSGNVAAGAIWLIGILIWDAIAVVTSILTIGVSLFCTLPISIVLIVISALLLNSYTKQHSELFGL